MQLLPRERQAREQRVLLEEKIADGEPGEEVHLRELPQLTYPLEKEEQLRRQGEAGHVLVEARQERILLRTLQDQRRVQPSGQTLGEARLADADRSFDYDVVIFRERHEAGARGKGRPSYTRRKRGPARALPPQIDGFAAPAQLVGTRLEEALEVRFAQVGPARDVFERTPEVKRAQVGLDAERLLAVRAEENHRRRVGEAERTRPVLGREPVSRRSRHRSAIPEREARHVETLQRLRDSRAAKALAVQLVAGRAGRRLEENGERFCAAPAQIVGRFEEEGLVLQLLSGRLPDRSAQVLGECGFSLLAAGDPVEHRLEAVRRIIAVQPRHDRAALVEKDERRRELYFQERREPLLGEFLSVRPDHLAVAPDVERNREEILSRLVGDRLLAEIGQDQLLAVGAAVLLEENHQPPAPASGLRHVFPEIEESLGEQARQGARLGARCGTRKEKEENEQRRQLHRCVPRRVSRGR